MAIFPEEWKDLNDWEDFLEKEKKKKVGRKKLITMRAASQKPLTNKYVLCLYYQIYDLTWSISLECTTLPKLILIEGFL